MNKNGRPLTEYQLFIKNNSRMRPVGIPPRQWMSQMAIEWKRQKQQAITAPRRTRRRTRQPMKECSICMEEKPMNDFKTGCCQHHDQVCTICHQRLDKCPFCRKSWKPHDRTHRQQHRQALRDIQERVDAAIQAMLDIDAIHELMPVLSQDKYDHLLRALTSIREVSI